MKANPLDSKQKTALAILRMAEPAHACLRRFYRRRSINFGVMEAERIALGISQGEMARRMRITFQAYQNLRRRLLTKGEVLRMDTIGKAAGAMGCTAVLVLVPNNGRTYGELVQLEAEKRAREEVKRLEKCRTAGRQLGGRTPDPEKAAWMARHKQLASKK